MKIVFLPQRHQTVQREAAFYWTAKVEIFPDLTNIILYFLSIKE